MSGCLASLALALPAQAGAEATWVVKGHGWGHAVGMSQYGAYGMAQHGFGYRQILGHYYRHTKIGREEGSVRVLLAPDVGVVSFSGATTGCGRSLKGDSEYSFVPAGSGVALQDAKGERLASCGSRGSAAGGKSIDLEDKGTYRGSLVARADSGTLDAINKVGIEAYVKGVVANEMPASWEAEALKAQAV
ncbi:MAG: SpoIID/LytB domain-containing protein, partial [Thermoleophilaceae bacterium]